MVSGQFLHVRTFIIVGGFQSLYRKNVPAYVSLVRAHVLDLVVVA